MTPQLCTFTQSKALKAAGYLEPSLFLFSEKGTTVKVDTLDAAKQLITGSKALISRPTISDAIRFFRIEKGIHGWVSKDEKGYRDMFHGVNDGWSWGGQYWDNHDDAENALLNRLIELTAKQD